MIPRLWCFLFGHVKYYDVFSGKTEVITDMITGGPRIIPIMSGRRAWDYCPRCGKKLI